MKRTLFYEFHRRLGARMIEFAGFEMPIEYSGISDEHNTVRKNVGLFDVSHMGEIWVKGENARDLVQKVTTNDVDRLKPGKAQYSCFPNGKGGIVDDLLVYMYEDKKYLLVVNAANLEKDWEWLNKNNDVGAELENSSDEISQLAVQGPMALNTLQKICGEKLAEIPSFNFITGKIGGVDDVIISNTGYTGSGGFELYFANDKGPQLWEEILNAGKEFGIKAVGLAARDTLRLEAGYCLYGNDIDETTSPIEAGLNWIVKFTPDNNFIDREILFEQKENGLQRKLIGFEMLERGIPRQHYKVLSLHGEEIGKVTSGTMSPFTQKGIGMAYVNMVFSTEGTEFNIQIRNRTLKARVVKTPFF